MYYRKIIATIFLSFCFFMFDNAFAENLARLAKELSAVHTPKDTKSIVDKQELYASLSKRFNALSVKDKNLVVQMGREFTLERYDKNMYESLQRAVSLAEKDGFFFGDLSDKEMADYFVIANQGTASTFSESSCIVRSFPDWINQADPDGSSVYYPHSYSEVANEEDEWPCDWELWYFVSKSHVWGTSWFANQLLENFGGGMSKRVYYGQDCLISGYLRTLFWLGSGSVLAQRIVIW